MVFFCGLDGRKASVLRGSAEKSSDILEWIKVEVGGFNWKELAVGQCSEERSLLTLAS